MLLWGVVTLVIRDQTPPSFHSKKESGIIAQGRIASWVEYRKWSQWECGARTPDELIAEFFGMTVERMRSDRRPQPGIHQAPPNIGDKPPGVREPPPSSWSSAPPGSAASFFWLAHHIIMSMETRGLRLDKESLEYLARCIKQS